MAMRTLLLAALCVIGLARPASAQEVKVTTYGKWEVGVGPDFVDAYTINDQGQHFGINCTDTEECIWIVSPPYGCREGDPGAALFNSQEGVLFLKLECSEFEIDTFFMFRDDPSGAFKNRTDVAFAFPGINATFMTMRFSLNGAAEAYERIMREVEKRQTKPAASLHSTT